MTVVSRACHIATGLISALLLVACAAVGSAPLSGGNAVSPPASQIISARDARVLIGAFGDISDVALSRRYLFAAAPGGIAVYDRVFNRWQNPVPVGFDGRGESLITALEADPVEDAIWFATPGAVSIYRPATDQLQRASLSGAADVITFSAGNPGEAFVRAQGQWFRVSRSGIVTPAAGNTVPASTSSNNLSTVYQRFPALRNQLVTLLREPLPNRPVAQFTATSGAVSPERSSEVWLGTNGNGVWKVDPTFQQATALRFGLPELGVGAVATDGNGVWAAPGDWNSNDISRASAPFPLSGAVSSGMRGDMRSGMRRNANLGQSGITYASNDLQHWRWVTGTIGVPMTGVRARDIALRGNQAWLATDRGALLMMLDGNENVYSISVLDGLPSNSALCVVARPNGAWIGTARGLAFISTSETTANGNANAGSNATTKARGQAQPDRARNAQPDRARNAKPHITRQLLSGVAVLALQAMGDTLFVGTQDGLYRLVGDALVPVHVMGVLQRTPVLALAWSDSALLMATESEVFQLDARTLTSVGDAGVIDATILARIGARSTGGVVGIAMDDRSILVVGRNGLMAVQRSNLLSTQLLWSAVDIPGALADVALNRDWVWVATGNGLLRLNRRSDGTLNPGIR